MVYVAPAGLAILALATAACSFDTRGLSTQNGGTLDLGALFPDGLLLEFPDAAPMQPLLDRGGQPLPESRPDRRWPADRSSLDSRPAGDLPPASCAANCSGCCQGEACEAGNSDLACGKAGAPCASCPALGEQCVAMACAPIPCASTVTCPAETVCFGSKCVSPYGLEYRVVVFGATINATNSAGGVWDSKSIGPDPYVVIKIAGTSWVTNTKTDTLLPIWNGYVSDVLIEASTALRFEVYDDDGNSSELIGAVELKPVSAAVLHAGTYTGANAGVKALKIALELE